MSDISIKLLSYKSFKYLLLLGVPLIILIIIAKEAFLFILNILVVISLNILEISSIKSYFINMLDNSIKGIKVGNKLLKQILKELNIAEDKCSVSSVASCISKAKDELKSCSDFEKEATGDFRQEQIAKIYKDIHNIKYFKLNLLDEENIKLVNLKFVNFIEKN